MSSRLRRCFAPALLGFCLTLGCSSQRRSDAPPASIATGTTSSPAASASASDSPDGRAEALLAQMTLEEKLAYVGGDRDFFIRAIPRLGIPEIKLADGPAGCRNWGPSTAYPAPIGIAASFDDALAMQVGSSIGRDCRARGVHILLAPGVNIQRSPLTGRNFEYLGEDPLLAAGTAVAFIRGVQGEGVLATVKHFVANNQEWDRNHVSSEVDERTLREIYFPAFERAVRDARVASVMTAYNLLNGTYCTHNEWLLKDVLKSEWGFGGFVMSDWKAAHDPLGTANGGCDLEMPSAEQMSHQNLTPLIEQRRVTVATIDDKVRRILRTIIAADFLDRPQKRDDIPLQDPRSEDVALQAARSSIVLLQNEGSVLPLDATRSLRIALIGPNAHPAVTGGSGSAYVTPTQTLSLLDALKQVSPNVSVTHHPGVQRLSDASRLGKPLGAPIREEIFNNKELAGAPVATRTVDRIDFVGDSKPPVPGVGAEHYSIRWTAQPTLARGGRYQLMTNSDDGIRVLVDGKKVIDDWNDHAPSMNTAALDLRAGKHEVVVEYYQGILGAVAQVGLGPALASDTSRGAAEVDALARAADVVVLSLGFGQSAETNSFGASYRPFWPPDWVRKAGIVETEDADRPFGLPEPQLETLRVAHAANANTVVVLNAGGGVDLSPVTARAKALLYAWYPGQNGAQALAEILFGQTSPSAKLPITLAKSYEDHPSAPFYNQNQRGKTPYSEGVFVGYRGFDAKRTEPAFPFGFGLSYTSFRYDDLVVTAQVDRALVRLKVKNDGSRPGTEIVQVYMAPPNTRTPRPPQELKAYAQVALEPGETKAVELALDRRAFSYWDSARRAWAIAPGKYEIRVGASSRDIRLRGSVERAERVLPN